MPIRIPIHIFGAIVAVGVTIGAAVMRRYARRLGEADADTRSVVAWVAATGFIGAHVFANPLTLFAIWTSISSYDGFVGGALGFAFIAWRRRLVLAGVSPPHYAFERDRWMKMRALKIDPHTFRGDWNYVVHPRTQHS